MSFFTSFQQNKNLVLSILGVSLIFIVGQWFQSDFVFDRSDIDTGQWWTIISGNFTHSNIPHLLLNFTGLCILGLLFIDNLSTRTFIFSIIFLAVIVGLGLWIYTPEIDRYYGFSGILYGLYFVAAVNAILHKDIFTGVSVAFLIAGKIVWDYFTGGNQSSADLIGIPVANDAHLYGFIGAIVISAFIIIQFRLKKNR